ncbi:hypothetical protein PA598K_02963 [Paenibacillus sp. 598K]|uniref:hypothetical protein n=1 Tax=Paenibacillus sp. 598K TaxID=1117987 RepID=UPI000FF97DB3|nr:hypothetical protein [Paenibacillus sp. 598K]GBF74606.1 hypothetical protein PA598K_02963 [Paenibacillus sp. 598K]
MDPIQTSASAKSSGARPLQNTAPAESREARPLRTRPAVHIVHLISPLAVMPSLALIYVNPYLPSGWSVVVTLGLIVLMAGFLYHVYYLIKGAPRICLGESWLEVNGQRYDPQELAMLLVRTGKAPALGIVPLGRKLAPMAYCARFGPGELDDMHRLVDWARRHGVKVRHKKVIAW